MLLGFSTACTKPSGYGGSSGPVLAQAPESPEVLGEVGAFSLTECSGKTITREDLLGQPWVAGFIFTRCSGPCPKVTSTMKKLQERLKGSRVHIVTFSVDPEYDTPAVLKEYAQAAGADPKRWLFLTGEEKVIHALVKTSFLSAVERAPAGAAPVGESVSHRTQLVAVDKQGHLRGFYHGESDDQLDELVARVKFLERESAAPPEGSGPAPR